MGREPLNFEVGKDKVYIMSAKGPLYVKKVKRTGQYVLRAGKKEAITWTHKEAMNYIANAPNRFGDLVTENVKEVVEKKAEDREQQNRYALGHDKAPTDPATYPRYYKDDKFLLAFRSPTTMYKIEAIGSNKNPGVTIDYYTTRKMVLYYWLTPTPNGSQWMTFINWQQNYMQHTSKK